MGFRHHHLRNVVSWAMLVLFACSMGCFRESSEAKVGKAFKACVSAVEVGDAPAAIDFLAGNFSGPNGMRRQEAAFFLMALLRREKVGVTVFFEQRQQRSKGVVQTVEVLLTSRSGASLLPQEASRKRYVLHWEKVKGDWKIRELREEL